MCREFSTLKSIRTVHCTIESAGCSAGAHHGEGASYVADQNRITSLIFTVHSSFGWQCARLRSTSYRHFTLGYFDFFKVHFERVAKI